jgi:hypothetical protein
VVEERLYELIEPVLRQTGATLEPGEEFRRPPLDVLRYYRRSVRWSGIPVVGRAVSVVAVLRQPADVELANDGYSRLLTRVAGAASSRFPPWKGMAIGLTGLIVTPEPIGPGDDAALGRALSSSLTRFRVVPVGLIRVNLGQDAISFAMKSSPDELFTEPARLADTLSEHFRRFVPLMKM